MKNSLYTLGLIVLVTFTSIAANAEEKHYRHLMFRESPYAPYQGIHPVSEAKSKSIAHYEFKYDQRGRVTRISRKFDDAIIEAHGVWDSFIWFAPEVKISYQDDTETHTYYNLMGKQIHAHGKVWKAVYRLDDSGVRRDLQFFDSKGKKSANAWNVSRYEWRPSDDGHIFERRFNLDGAQEKFRPELDFYEVKLEYDTKGQLAFMRNFGLEHKPTNNDSGAGIDRVTYDLEGNFIRWQVYDKDGIAVEGNRPMVHLGEHLYDSYGNKIGLRGFDRHGNQIPFSWGSMMGRYQYNDKGAQIGVQTYLQDGTQTANFEYEYNHDLSKQLTLKSLDNQGNLKVDKRLRGGSLIKFTYDDNRNRSRTIYNADGSLLKQQ